MDRFSDTFNYRETDPVLPEYDIDDVKLSIQETIDAIEKIIFKRSVEIKKNI